MVTPRNEATAGVRGADEQWRMLAEALPLIVWSARPDGFIEYQNNRWYEFSGLRPGTLGDEWRDLVHPDDLSRVASRWDNSIRTGEPFELEYRMRRRDGAWRWLLSRGLPARDEAGGIVRWLGSCTDITDIVGAREAMAREADRLEQMVAQRTRDLQDTQARLAHAQRMEALGQLAGGIAHDFNNVLQSVQGGAELIEQHADDLERTRRLSRVVQGAATRGMAITRRLLALSRYSDLRSEPVEAGPLLAGMAEIFASTLGRGIEVRVEAAAALPLLFADKGQLETVLINLATNARDAMQGTGTLTLAAAAETLAREGGPRHPVGLKPGDYVRLSVTDTPFTPGTSVKKGDLLVRQDTSTEEAQLPGAVAQATLTKTILDRDLKMLEKKIISQADFDTAVANYQQAVAQADNIRTTIAKKTIHAPFSGRLGIRQVNLGQILREGDPIVTLQTLDPIYVNFSLPQQELGRLHSGLPVKVTCDALPGVTVEGRITAMNPLVDADTRNIQVQATVANRGEISGPACS